MRITNLEAYSVAIPFIAPIFSAYGVSYPARLRTMIRVHTDEGLVGVGEAGVSAAHLVRHGEQQQVFEQVVKPAILGEDPFDYLAIMKKLRYIPESIAVELACWDLMGKATGLPVYRLLGGCGYRASVPVAAYFFFRAPCRNGGGAVDLDNCVEHVQWLIDTYGFRTVKLKLGVYEPLLEVEAVRRVRAAIGPHIKLRIDPNGCWSLPTAKRMLKLLEDCDLEFVEEPIKFIPARRPVSTQDGVPSIDTVGLAALRRATSTPIAVDGAYRIDLLWQVARDQAADVVLGDIQGCFGIKGLYEFYTVAQVLNLAGAMHSGTEIGVQQVAKLHVAAARPELTHAGDAIYHEYADDVLVGGLLPYREGEMPVPQAPGLGVELDDERLARYELTPERHREYDAYWAEIKRQFNIPPAGSDLLVRHF
jgi:glucarate dehydratase